jgi:hypothetical protein|tara:strand:+ start:450 stop:785 length:336 start_codon:yes stop_codon:yes gene_type:complete
VLATVFVTQENPRFDLVSAREWGDLNPLASPHDQIHTNPGRMVSHIRRKLHHFNDDDWLLAMGDPAIIGIAFAIAADINRGKVNLLKWDKMERTYYPVRISIGGGITELQT